MIEVITVGRVVKFDKEKKIIAFLNIKKMKEKEKLRHNWMITNPCMEVVLGDFHMVDYPDRICYNTENFKSEILQRHLAEMKTFITHHLGTIITND